MRNLLLPLLLAVPAAAQLRAPLPKWAPPFAPASAATVTRMRTVLKSPEGAGLMKQPAYEILSRLDPQSEPHRALAGAIGLTEEFGVPGLQEWFTKQEAERKIAEAIEARADEIFEYVDQGNLDRAEIIDAAKDLEAFAQYSSRARKIQSLAAAARSERGAKAAQELAAQLRRGWGVEDAPGGVYAGPRASDAMKLDVEPRLTEAKLALRELGKSYNEFMIREAVEQLKDITVDGVGQRLQNEIMEGVAGAASRAAPSGSLYIVLDGVKVIAKTSGKPVVYGIAATALMEEIPKLLPHQREETLELVAELVSSLEDPIVKRRVALKLRDLDKARFERVVEAAGGMEVLFAMPPSPHPKRGVLGKTKDGFMRRVDMVLTRLEKGTLAHPVGALFGAVAILMAVTALIAGGWSPLLVAPIAAGLAVIVAEALFRDHPVAAFFHVGAVANVLTAAAKAGIPLGPVAVAVLALGWFVTADVSLWSLRKNRPVLGFFAVALVSLIFQYLALGPEHLEPVIKITTGAGAAAVLAGSLAPVPADSAVAATSKALRGVIAAPSVYKLASALGEARAAAGASEAAQLALVEGLVAELPNRGWADGRPMLISSLVELGRGSSHAKVKELAANGLSRPIDGESATQREIAGGGAAAVRETLLILRRLDEAKDWAGILDKATGEDQIVRAAQRLRMVSMATTGERGAAPVLKEAMRGLIAAIPRAVAAGPKARSWVIDTIVDVATPDTEQAAIEALMASGETEAAARIVGLDDA